MIYTVTLNPAIDYVIGLPKLELGELNRTEVENFYPGGKGINVSRVLTELDVKNMALGFVAGFTGHFIENSLRERSVQTDFVHLTRGCSRIGVKLKTRTEETEVNAKGPLVDDEATQKLIQKFEQLEDGDSLVLAGKIANGMSEDFYEIIMQKLSNRKINIVVDATKDSLLKTLPYHPFLIKPNREELADIFSTEIKHEADIIQYGKKLQQMGAQNVLISLASEGSILIASDGNIYKSNAPSGIVQNSVGAGDSMVAGFVAGYAKTHDYQEALKLGSASGSATAFSSDLATASDIEDTVQKIKIEKI